MIGLKSLAASLILLFILPIFAYGEVCPNNDVSHAELAQIDGAIPISTQDKLQAERTHLPWGFPSREGILYHHEFIIAYEVERRVPLWAAYRLRAQDVVSAQRRDAFRTDPRLQEFERSVCADYQEPIFDRGHLVPRADMNRSAAAQAFTYFLSSMTPQHDRFNRQIWNTLEGMVRDWAQVRGTVYVITCSVFDRDSDGDPDGLGGTDWMMPTRRVGVPSHFYKIVLHERMDGTIDSLAILLPHLDENPPDHPAHLRTHLVSIDEIESRTGLDFLPGMGPLTETAVERALAVDLWHRQ